jgi:hypothetical protein
MKTYTRPFPGNPIGRQSGGRSKTLTLIFSLVVLSLAGPAGASTGRTGAQMIGLEAFASNELDSIIQIYSSCPAHKACELHALAYSFVQGSVADVHDSVTSFRMTEAVVKGILPKLTNGQVFVLTLSLDDGPNRNLHPSWVSFAKDMTTATFWSKVANNDSSFEAKWKQIMVAPYAQFATRIQAWAAARKCFPFPVARLHRRRA